MIKLNAVKSKYDSRDLVYRCSDNKLTSYQDCDYTDELLPIRDQGEQGTCYAQSAACVKEWQEKKKNYFSPQFIYNNRDYWNNGFQDGEDYYEDYGMEGRDVMKIMKNAGVCDEELYPYGIIGNTNSISDFIKDNAKQNVIKGYARILTIDSMKQSLINNGPCLIAFPVYNYTDQMWIKNDTSDNLLGGHAMTVVGFDDLNQCFKIRNSWGKYWGENGYTKYYYKDWGSHWEAWTTIDDLSNNITPLTDEELENNDEKDDKTDNDQMDLDSQEDLDKNEDLDVNNNEDLDLDRNEDVSDNEDLDKEEDIKENKSFLQSLCEKILGNKS